MGKVCVCFVPFFQKQNDEVKQRACPGGAAPQLASHPATTQGYRRMATKFTLTVRRRALLIRGLSMGIGFLLPSMLADAPLRIRKRGNVGDTGGAKVPCKVVRLADHGGMPGAGPALLVDAFTRAFAALTKAGGGTLFVSPGIYDFGSVSEAATIILCRDLRNVAISAYGATFTANTTANVMPHFFYFFNFENVTLAGASFFDRGFNPWIDWKGVYCAGIQADQASSGFRMVDCYAERVVGLLASHNNPASRKYMSDITVHGEVRHAYYGVGASYIRENVSVELTCFNVRRAFIAYALKNATIMITADNSSDWPGSNGFVALVSNGASAGNVENVRVRVDVSGECIHGSYVHFYHQGSEKEGYMRDIDATVNVFKADSTRNLFVFDHDAGGVQTQTARVWDRIALHGAISGRFSGQVVSNPSKSTAPGRVLIDRNLAKLGATSVLAAGFRVQPP